MEGFVNSAAAVEALEFYKALYQCCTPPGYTDGYMQEGLDAFKSGQVAMMMNWFAFFPGLHKDPGVGGDRIGFFVNPKERVEASTLGGQGISVVAYSDKQEEALSYIKWFAQPDVQKKWWALGGYSCHKAVLLDANFKNTAPFAEDFLKAMSGVQDFWQEPAYASLLQASQKRFHAGSLSVRMWLRLSSATNRASGISAASRRPWSNGMRASPRACTTSVGTRTFGSRARTLISPKDSIIRAAISGCVVVRMRSLNQRTCSGLASGMNKDANNWRNAGFS